MFGLIATIVKFFPLKIIISGILKEKSGIKTGSMFNSQKKRKIYFLATQISVLQKQVLSELTH